MHPIVVAYPRSGSEILTNIVFNYAHRVWNSERCLQEFLLVTFFRSYDFSFVNNKIEGSYWSIPKDQWKENWNTVKDKIYEISQERISWLQTNPNYVFKLITTPRLTDSQYDWCLKNFHCIFIQRNDKIRSFLSFLFLYYIGTHHSLDADTIKKQNLKIKFDINFAKLWVWDYKKYNLLRDSSTDKSILVYEDLLVDGAISEDKILKTLGWEIPKDYKFYKFQTKPTPYEDDDIINYFENKDEVLDYIKSLPEIFD
jgi:hypothetical protein